MSNKILIAGPCSVETYDQLDRTAAGLSGLSLDYLRGGLWKPRTRPGSYEGIGIKGVQWMADIKAKYGLKVITEVAKPTQVEPVLKAGFDAVWVGARTSVNPFYVQEIADALKGTDIPVFIKNPINPDLKLWIGSMERMRAATKNKVHAIHRGFSTFHQYKYRNTPQWTLAIALRQEMPDISLICDPSHIAGDRSMILEVSQHAYDLQYDGLMIETHHDPDHALSDSAQQITPGALKKVLSQLIVRNASPGPMVSSKLDHLRDQIDHLDAELIELLGRRMNISSTIGELKAEENISILQPKRWQWIVQRAITLAQDQGISESFVKALFNVIHQESIDRQINVMRHVNQPTKSDSKA